MGMKMMHYSTRPRGPRYGTIQSVEARERADGTEPALPEIPIDETDWFITDDELAGRRA